ncbi:MAG: ABC transporter ATP-binding protein [Ignavibacteriales bacterium]|nr:MAG: ABC transporter ATP-binding protein [Ignavibacteriaceae bacterium]MBW7872593.1 ABC transporter ATP-binding protein [Ignavibacteria bacterium]MBZ0198211.1 ABC transporter ATP-binding protein [Ignavibacteriaceae bacterium]MCZ2141854.1 ABC transporter ATP-binding protein [Ignavibacteriales bacterium]
MEVTGLHKKYKQIHAVNSLDLNVYEGDVFGFLGPNGAGKSTTIRMLLSLIFPTQGKIKIFGKELLQNRKEILASVGAIVEKPDFYGYMTAYKNLDILSRISGFPASKKKIMETLEMVRLEKRWNSKVKTFSHGMKQRLGIAQALIHDPKLIILDEPTTGLDPQGMKEVRDLVISLSKDFKKTVFLSSHILHEVELIANRMVIINKGKTVTEGTVQELLNATETKVAIEVDDTEKAAALLNESSFSLQFEPPTGTTLHLTMMKEQIPALNRLFVENGISVSSIVPTRSLEEYFLNLTGKEGQ